MKPNPFFLRFEDSFEVTFKSFLAIWKNMRASSGAEPQKVVLKRVSKLLFSNLRYIMGNIEFCDPSIIQKFEKEMLETPLITIRERHSILQKIDKNADIGPFKYIIFNLVDLE